jgi:plastocyanin
MLATLGLALAGCGHTATVGRDRTLRLALTEYRVVPQKVQVSAGELTIFVHNEGKLTHNLAITDGKNQVLVTPPIWPGATTKLTVALAPGGYTIGSTLFSDQALGQYGSLTVTSNR